MRMFNKYINAEEIGFNLLRGTTIVLGTILGIIVLIFLINGFANYTLKTILVIGVILEVSIICYCIGWILENWR